MVASDLKCRVIATPRLSQSLSDGWRELCDRFLPVTSVESIWRYSRARSPLDPEQGWKLHLSATVLTANRLLEAVGPLLQSSGILFKGPLSLGELNKLNCGLFYGYTQVGKCLTVYPRTAEETVALAEMLHRMTLGIPGPTVPFDSRFKPDSCVYYRYGAFTHQEIRNEDGTSTMALRDPDGKLVPDLRESWVSKPGWVSDLFPSLPRGYEVNQGASPLKTTYRVFRALKQRGKGGVYLAVDLSAKPPRLCVVKEGRRHGEPGWDGRDGYWRIKNEKKNLCALRAAGVEVPHVYSSFEAEGRFYLVTEFIEGVSLQELLNRRERRLPMRCVLQYALQLSELLSQIHDAGWVWRDCKPSNLLATKGSTLRPLDFEGACRSSSRNSTAWMTPAFVPPESLGDSPKQSRPSDDLYAFGVIIYYLLSGRFPSATDQAPVEKLRRGVPAPVRYLVSELLDADPSRRPAAQFVTNLLESALRSDDGAGK